jgi:hypothetical protein
MDALSFAVARVKTPSEKRQIEERKDDGKLPPITVDRMRELGLLKKRAAMGGVSLRQSRAELIQTGAPSFDSWS